MIGQKIKSIFGQLLLVAFEIDAFGQGFTLRRPSGLDTYCHLTPGEY